MWVRKMQLGRPTHNSGTVEGAELGYFICLLMLLLMQAVMS